MEPLSGRSAPAKIFISVDLPAPFSPTSATILPPGTSRLMSWRTVTPLNVLVIPVAFSVLIGRSLHADHLEHDTRTQDDIGVGRPFTGADDRDRMLAFHLQLLVADALDRRIRQRIHQGRDTLVIVWVAFEEFARNDA